MTDFATWLHNRYTQAGQQPDGFFTYAIETARTIGLGPTELQLLADTTGATTAEIAKAYKLDNTERAGRQHFEDATGLTSIRDHLSMQAIGHHVPEQAVVAGPEARYEAHPSDRAHP